MAKVTFIGAGSTVFSRNLLQDLFTFPELQGSTIHLMDIDADRLRDSEIVAHRVADAANANATILATTDRREAIAGADYVINMIQVGGYEPSTVIDFEIPKKYGLRQTIAAQQRGPWSSQGKGSHDWDFRRSIAWPSDSLRAPSASLVGFAGPVARRHARLASSCWSGSPGRGSHPRGSDERFQITSHPPFPALLGANDASTVGSPAPSPLGRMVAITGDVKPSTHLAYRLNFGFRIEEHVLRVPAVGEIELNPFRTEMYIE